MGSFEAASKPQVAPYQVAPYPVASHNVAPHNVASHNVASHNVAPHDAAPYNVAPYNDEHLALDFAKKLVALDAERMILTRKEYDLLALLVQHAGEIIPRHALLLQVWGYGADIRTRTLDVHVRRLRKKLGGYADQYIETIFGIGYRFQPFHAPRFFQAHTANPVIALSA